MRKARLVNGLGHTLHPFRASLAFRAAPWGVQQICVVYFRRVSTATRWACHLPISPNTTVLHCGVFDAASIGTCTTVTHARHGAEAVLLDVASLNGQLRLLFVTVQPMSYKRLFMEWLPFGTPSTTCKLSCALDLSELPTSFQTQATLRQGVRGRPIRIDGSTAQPIALRHRDNAKLTIRVQHPRGFHVPRPVFAPDAHGQYVVIHGDHDDGGTKWYIKSGPKDAEGDNLMVARTSPEVPEDVQPAGNSELLQCVADSILDKDRSRKLARRISISNVRDMLETVQSDPLCWSVTTPRTLCGHHPYVEDLAKLSQYMTAAGIHLEELEQFAQSVIKPELHSDAVRSVLRAVFDED